MYICAIVYILDEWHIYPLEMNLREVPIMFRAQRSAQIKYICALVYITL